MGFIIAGTVILLILLIMLLWIRLSLIYNESGTVIAVKVLFFKIAVVGKKKKHKKSDYKLRKFRRRRNKAIRKYRKRLEKQKKKTAKKPEQQSKPKKKVSKKETVKKLLDIFAVFLKRFPRYLRIDCARLIIGVGGKEAAETAINYGVTVQSVQYIGTLLNNVTNFEAKNTDKINVYPDFASGKWTADINIVMRLRVIHIIKLGIAVLSQYIKQKLGIKKTTNENGKEKRAA